MMVKNLARANVLDLLNGVYHFFFFSIFLLYAMLLGNKLVMLFIVAVTCCSFFFLMGRNQLFLFSRYDLPVLFSVVALFILFLMGQFFWATNTSSFVVAAPMAIFLLLKNSKKEYVEYVLFLFLLAVVFIAAVEKFNGQYLYVASTAISGGVELDEKLFSGASDFLRAKSIFLGPLSLSAFLIGTSFVLRENRLALTLCMIGVIFAVSRSGIFLVLYVAVVMELLRQRKNLMLRSVMVFVLVLLGFIAVAEFNPMLLERLYDALDFSGGSSTNNARVYYWLSGVKEFSNYALVDMIVGNNGYFREKFGNNAESGWITILLDFGILGLLLYVFPLLCVVFSRPRLEVLSMVFIIVVANGVFTFCYGVSGCFIYWTAVYLLSRYGPGR